MKETKALENKKKEGERDRGIEWNEWNGMKTTILIWYQKHENQIIKYIFNHSCTICIFGIDAKLMFSVNIFNNDDFIYQMQKQNISKNVDKYGVIGGKLSSFIWKNYKSDLEKWILSLLFVLLQYLHLPR